MQLMAHVVIGYPTLRETERIVGALVRGGAAKIELQIPFSDPVADGPVIAAANDLALKNGLTQQQCLTFAQKITRGFPQIEFYFMSYYNPILAFGLEKFVSETAKVGLNGFIIPDLPFEESAKFSKVCRELGLDFIPIVAPNTPPIRLRKIVVSHYGFVYCASRLGVTGRPTAFDLKLKKFLTRVQKFTTCPLAIGFGVSRHSDVAAIQKAGGSIAVVGSAIIRVHEKGGVSAVERLVKNLIAKN